MFDLCSAWSAKDISFELGWIGLGEVGPGNGLEDDFAPQDDNYW